MSEVFAVGDWCRYRRHRTPYRIIDRQSLWNEMGFRVWLPTKDAIIRARASDLAPLASLEPTKNEILHTAAGGGYPSTPCFRRSMRTHGKRLLRLFRMS